MKNNPLLSFLASPLGFTAGLSSGIVAGIYFPNFVNNYAFIATSFITLFKLCVLPVILTAIITGLLLFLKNPIQQKLRGFFLIKLSYLIFVSSIAYILTTFMNPGGKLDIQFSPVILESAIKMAKIERDFYEDVDPVPEKNFSDLLTEAIPANLFAALANERMIQIIVFSLLFGFILSKMSENHQNTLKPFIESTGAIFRLMYSKVAYMLPIVIFFSIGNDVANFGVDTISALLYFVGTLYLIIVIVFILSLAILSYRTRTNPYLTVVYIRGALVVAFSGKSHEVAIPLMTEALIKKFNLNEPLVDMIAPISSTFGQYGNLLFFTCSAVFVAQFYQFDFTFGAYFIVLLMANLAALLSIRTSGESKFKMIAVILTPLGVPVSASLVLFDAIDTTVNFATHVTSVMANCAAISLMVPRADKKSHVVEES